jgi:hypothetical protein
MVWSLVKECGLGKHELRKFDFEMIDDALGTLQSGYPNTLVQAKIVDLRDKFRDSFTGWLGIDGAA